MTGTITKDKQWPVSEQPKIDSKVLSSKASQKFCPTDLCSGMWSPILCYVPLSRYNTVKIKAHNRLLLLYENALNR